MSTRPAAITAAGFVLSQATRHTSPSNMCPRHTSSIESAITSREIRLVRMPSVPMVTPSEIAIVLNSIGVPPASRTPRFTSSASSRWFRLHGIVSIHVVTTPMLGLARSSSVNPTPLSIDRAPARPGPWVIVALCRFPLVAIEAILLGQSVSGHAVRVVADVDRDLVGSFLVQPLLDRGEHVGEVPVRRAGDQPARLVRSFKLEAVAEALDEHEAAGCSRNLDAEAVAHGFFG